MQQYLKEMEQVILFSTTTYLLIFLYLPTFVCYYREFGQDPYDPDEFVERMAYRVFGSSVENDNSIVDDVQETFVQAIKYYDTYAITFLSVRMVNLILPTLISETWNSYKTVKRGSAKNWNKFAEKKNLST